MEFLDACQNNSCMASVSKSVHLSPNTCANYVRNKKAKMQGHVADNWVYVLPLFHYWFFTIIIVEPMPLVVEDFYYWNSSDPRRYPWMKICSDTDVYEIQPGHSCSKGVQFPEYFVPHCVCPFGLWIVKAKLCEIHTHFLLGDARRNICYLIDFQIESVMFLGDPNNVYASKAFVAPLHLTVFYEIPMDGSFTPLLDLDKPLIIHMFPENNRSIEAEDGNCFPIIQPNEANTPVHIWSAALGPTRYRIVEKCQDPLNFGFDDLIAPNMVFIRSNLINEIPIPRLGKCSPSVISRCNAFTTTMRPLESLQLHTPRYHEKLFYDLAKVSPNEVEKQEKGVPREPDFPSSSLEVEPPLEVNFSRFVGEQIVQVQLPTMLSSMAYDELFKQTRREQKEKLKESGLWDYADDSSSESGQVEDELVGDIMKDIVEKDDFVKDVLLRKMNGSQSANSSQYFSTFKEVDTDEFDNDHHDDDYEEEGTDSPVKVDGKNVSQSSSSYEVESYEQESSEKQVNNDATMSEYVESLNGAGGGVENVVSIQNHSSPSIANNSMQNSSEHSVKAETSSRRKRWMENRNTNTAYSQARFSGLCAGSLFPPQCPSQGQSAAADYMKKLNISWIARTQTKSLKVNFVEEIAQVFDNLVELFLQSCLIPEEVVSTFILKQSIRLFLAQVDLGEVHNLFANLTLPSSSIRKMHDTVKSCMKVSGKIDFLFDSQCPVHVSCIRYTTAADVSFKVLVGQRPSSPHKNVLSTTLQAIIQYITLMCRKHVLEENGELTSLINLFEHTLSLIETSETHGGSYLDLQTQWKIHGDMMPYSLLQECVFAAETIWENRGITSHHGHPAFGERRKRARRRMKRSLYHHRPHTVFDGKAICMESYWDGVNRENPEHKCIPSQKF